MSEIGERIAGSSTMLFFFVLPRKPLALLGFDELGAEERMFSGSIHIFLCMYEFLYMFAYNSILPTLKCH